MPLPYSLDFVRLSRAYASGALTPSRVIAGVLEEIDRTRSNPVWIDVVPAGELLARAAKLEARRARGQALPLYGLPFAVKDNIDVAGRPTTAACREFAYVPARSAHVVTLLEAAGAILVGKTNLDQFATGLVGTRSPYGACRNPFDERYISGGSSSGSAVAVALGHVSFALGTDTAGSGRVPAGFCNLVGLKPTRGLIGTSGVVPACRSLDCVSIFALTVDDATQVLGVAAAIDPGDPYSRARPEAAYRRPRTIGVPRAADLELFGDAIAARAYNDALARLAALDDVETVEFDLSPFAEVARLLYEGPWVAERLLAIKPFFDKSAGALHPVTRRIIAAGAVPSALDTFEAQHRLQALAQRCAKVWSSVDVLLVPTAGTIYRIDEVEAEPVQLNTNLGYYTNFVNLLDLCAAAVPTGFREDGLPFGVTLIAPAFQESTLLDLAARLQHAPLGATAFERPHDVAARDAGAIADSVQLAVVGAHLSGLPLNAELTSCGARFVEACATAPDYRLYALPDTKPPKPGLVRVGSGRGSAIAAELWDVPLGAFGAFVAGVPPPLAIGTLTLADGRRVKGFLCEGYALEGARDISGYGGWRGYLGALADEPIT